MTAPFPSFDLAAGLDEGHRALLDALPHGLLDLTDIPVARAAVHAFFDATPTPELPSDVQISDTWIPGHADDPDVRVKLYRPADLAPGSSAIYWIHGGGMILFDADRDDPRCAEFAARHGCLVVSVDYRLAPEHPAPAPIHDCYAGLVWLAATADALGIDPDRIVIGGASAGGGLAAGAALFARDHGGPSPMAQFLVYPMLDHRNVTASSHRIVDDRVWHRAANVSAWDAYLGGGEPTPYSSPSIADDLSGLPPAYVNVGSFDLFLDENVDFALRLNAAGTLCELHVYPGAFHGSNGMLPDHPLSLRWRADEATFLERVLNR